MSSIDSYASIALQLASTVIISRLLTPAEVGICSIAAVFHALASACRDFGIGEYLIQERDLTQEKIRAAFGLNILVSWLMAVSMVAIGPVAAGFYREEGIRDVMAVMALSFVIVPFGAILQAWFRRELKYTSIVTSNVIASVGTFIVSIALAWYGFGYMSLAWSSFASMALTVLVMLWFRPKDFPRWPGVRGIAQVFHFGKNASSLYVAAQLGRGAPGLIIGRASGSADVGIFSRANGLVEMFNRLVMQPVLQICMPYFARSQRASGTITIAYARSVALLTAVGWPFLGVLAAAAYPAIQIIYGSQWLHAVSLAQVLCVAAMIELPFTLSREALLANGDAPRANRLQLQLVGLQVLGLSAAVPYGLDGAAWGLAAAAVAGGSLTLWHLRRGIGLHVIDLLAAIGPSAILAISVITPIVLMQIWIPANEGNYLRWALGTALASVAMWLVGLRLLKHPLWRELHDGAAHIFNRRA